MNDRPRLPRDTSLAPGAKVFAGMLVALVLVVFALLMTGGVAGTVWFVRWIMAPECGG
ncbi:UNVERIFIED_ORG: hypothetical protein BDU10_7436 [Burkholderia sp. CF145]